jgi:uncharacterized membrane protein YdjX (TVP38/TMEM64 family)
MTQKKKLISFIAATIILLGFYLLWHASPIAQYTHVDSLLQIIEDIQEYRTLPLVFVGIYLIAGLTLFPMTVLNIVLVLVYGPWIGFGYAYIGNVLSALLTFCISRYLGHKSFQAISGQRIQSLSQLMAQKGIISVIFLRITPISFAILSMIAGISHIKTKDYLWGTLIGITPGIFLVCFFASKIQQLLYHPTFQDICILISGGFCLIIAWNWLYRRLKKVTGQEKNTWE